jgi:hypothetical protein
MWRGSPARCSVQAPALAEDESDPGRHRQAGTSVTKIVTALAAVAPDGLDGAVDAESHVLGEIFPRNTPAEAGSATPWSSCATSRRPGPQMVGEARTISGSVGDPAAGPTQPRARTK